LLREIPCSKANRESQRNCLKRLKISGAPIPIFVQKRRKFPVSPFYTSVAPAVMDLEAIKPSFLGSDEVQTMLDGADANSGLRFGWE
jgi:hypothetical protein